MAVALPHGKPLQVVLLVQPRARRRGHFPLELLDLAHGTSPHSTIQRTINQELHREFPAENVRHGHCEFSGKTLFEPCCDEEIWHADLDDTTRNFDESGVADPEVISFLADALAQLLMDADPCVLKRRFHLSALFHRARKTDFSRGCNSVVLRRVSYTVKR